MSEQIEGDAADPYATIPVQPGAVVRSGDGVIFKVTDLIDAYDVDLPPERVDEWGSFAVKGHPDGNWHWEKTLEVVE